MQASPLKQEHCDALDCVLKSVQPTRELLQACEDCGLDVSEQKRILEGQEQLAAKLKAKFFPYKP